MNALKNRTEYQVGLRGISHIIEIMLFGPGPRSIWMPKGRKKTIKIAKMPIIIATCRFMMILSGIFLKYFPVCTGSFTIASRAIPI